MPPSPISALNRRTFLRTGATAATAAVALPRVVRAESVASPRIQSARTAEQRAQSTDPEFIRQLTQRAIDAAMSAGASYADARVIRFLQQSVLISLVAGEGESRGIGVRALVNGAWGFAASPYWTQDDAATLGRVAAQQARENAKWMTQRYELAPTPVATGSWTSPFEIDPFSIPYEEKMDFLRDAWYNQPYRRPDIMFYSAAGQVYTTLDDRTLATSEGTYITQRNYLTAFGYGGSFMLPNGNTSGQPESYDRVGWELIASVDFRERGRILAEDAYAAALRPVKPVDVGRYTLVADAGTMGALIGTTIAQATDLDRVLGFEANADGTSYLGSDPLALLGTHSFGSPLLNISGMRSGCNPLVKTPTSRWITETKWDDEGVEVAPFPIVTNGILEDIATTRDRAMLLAPYYQRIGRPVASRGCAVSGVAFDQTTVGPPTLVMKPASESVGLADLISSVPRGLAISGGWVETDFQLRRLVLRGQFREIVNGRLGAVVANAAAVFSATEIWKGLMAIGGPESTGLGRGGFAKGQPTQSVSLSAVAVPGVFKEATVVDLNRMG